MKVFRIDQAQARTFGRTPAGFLQASAALTRVGVFKYRKPDGSTVRELRHPDDVFDLASLETLKCVPVTSDHPKVNDGYVDISNVKVLSVGFIGDSLKVEDNKIVAVDKLTITDEKTIQKAEAGTVELSCGYSCEFEDVPGIYEGEAFDKRQKNIVYNHVALVDSGRAGPEIRLRLDSNSAVLESIADNFIIPRGEKMEKMTIDGKEYDVSPELKLVLEKMLGAQQASTQQVADATKAKADAEKAVVDANTKATDATKTAEVAQAKLDAALEENKKFKTDSSDDKKINELAEEKMKVISVAKHVLGASFKADGLTNIEMKKQVLEKSGVDVKTKTEVYVEARYDAVAESLASEISAIQTFGERVIQRQDSVSTRTPEVARAEAAERAKNQWKTK